MLSDEYSALDAVTILNELARVVRASPHSITPATNDRLARELEAVAGATARDAELRTDAIASARAYGGREWANSLIVAFFPTGADEQVLARLNKT